MTLRLTRQLSESTARTLVGLVRGLDLLCLTDPCATIPLSVAATEGGLPALGLSAAAYDRTSLLQCLVSAPPTVLYVDPLAEGGPYAARQLAGIARVLQVDVALTALAGEDWLTTHCAELAAALPACRQPVELPLSWTVETLRALHVRDGTVALAGLWSGPPSRPSTSSDDESVPR